MMASVRVDLCKGGRDMKRSETMHHPWDHGNLRSLSVAIRQRTIKALCGRRVAFTASTISQHISCPGCRAALRTKVEECDALLAGEPEPVYAGVPQEVIDNLRRALLGARDFYQAVLDR